MPATFSNLSGLRDDCDDQADLSLQKGQLLGSSDFTVNLDELLFRRRPFGLFFNLQPGAFTSQAPGLVRYLARLYHFTFGPMQGVL